MKTNNDYYFKQAVERLTIAQHLGVYRDGAFTPCNGLTDEQAARVEISNCLYLLAKIH